MGISLLTRAEEVIRADDCGLRKLLWIPIECLRLISGGRNAWGLWSSKAWIIIDHLQGMIGLDTLAFWGRVPVAAEAAVSFQLVHFYIRGGWVEGGKSPFVPCMRPTVLNQTNKKKVTMVVRGLYVLRT